MTAFLFWLLLLYFYHFLVTAKYNFSQEGGAFTRTYSGCQEHWMSRCRKNGLTSPVFWRRTLTPLGETA